jgi:hypothetical protein
MPIPSDDLSKSVEGLINDLDKLNADATSATNPKANAIAVITAIGKFSCILTVLSRQAEIQTKKVINLTWGLLVLTIVLLLFTAVQLAVVLKQ